MSEIRLLLTEIQALKRRIQSLETVEEHPGFAASDVARLSQDNTFAGIQTIPNTGLHILDTNGSHDLIIAPGSDLSSDVTLSLVMTANRTLTLNGELTLNGDLTVNTATTISTAAATVLDDATVATMVNTLGGAPSVGTGGLVRATLPTLVGKLSIERSGSFSGLALQEAGFAHGITDKASTDIFGAVIPYGATGGLYALGISEATSVSAFYFDGVNTNASGNTVAIVRFAAGVKSGTGATSVPDTEKAFQFLSGTSAVVTVLGNGNSGFGIAAPTAKIHADQFSTTAAIPVLTLDQADLSEEFINFVGTVGTGNSIEAVGAKTLTTTHFLRMQIEGVGYVYVPAGTIA